MGIGTAFISHKHKDKEIARVVGEFLKDASGNRVDVFLSSDSRFEGPRPGARLDEELEKAIAASGVVILIYTGKAANIDWEYCIYECAFARSRGIRVIVLQCCDQAPAPFLSTVRTAVSEKTDIQKFTKDFLTSPTFFKGQEEKVTAYAPADPAVNEKATIFQEKVCMAVRKHLAKEPHEWSAWPSLRLKLNAATFTNAGDGAANSRLTSVREELLDRATVTESFGADRVFGRGIEDGDSFGELVASWHESYPEDDMAWLDSLCTQIDAFSRKRFPELPEARLREVQGNASVLPVVSVMLSHDLSKEHEYEVRFYNILPKSRSIREVMIDRDRIHFERLDSSGGSNLSLKAVYEKLRNGQIFRLPLLDSEHRVRYMVHRSVITEFLLDSDGAEPTMRDLLQKHQADNTLNSTIAFVDANSTVEEARKALAEVDGGRDVFVTANGEREEPILGMVPNTHLEEPT